MKRVAAIVAATLLPVAAAAQTTGVLATKRPITWGMIFALLFLMLGPIKLVGPFAATTKDCDRVFRLRLVPQHGERRYVDQLLVGPNQLVEEINFPRENAGN